MLQELFNVLDLPGSSVRDIFAGENPLDQWASPLSDRHRVSGAELVSKYTGARPDSWGSTIAGFGAEMLLDPTNLIGGAGMLKRAVAARRAMTTNKSIDALNAGAEAANLGRYGMVNAGRVDDLSSPLTAIPAAVPESVTGRGLPYDPMVGYQAEPFYSKIQEVAERGKLPNQVWPDQLRGTLLGAGVSPEELDDLASPLSEAFANAPRGKLTRDDVYDIGADSVYGSLEDVTNMQYGGLKTATLGSPKWFDAQGELDTLVQDRDKMWSYLHYAESGWPADKEIAAKILRENPNILKYFDGGGVNKDRLIDVGERIGVLRDQMVGMAEAPQFSLYRVPGGKPGTYQETLIKSPLSSNYADGHFVGHGDTIAHLRSDVIKLPDGRDSLRVTEVQSDLHQAGAERGYGAASVRDTVIGDEQANQLTEELTGRLGLDDWEDLPVKPFDFVGKTETEFKEALKESLPQEFDGVWEYLSRNFYVGPLTDFAADLGKEVPDAPFKRSWHELALKTALHKAVTEGYDTISLVKGADSAVASSGPEDKLGKFYDEKVFLALKKMIKKHGGDVREMSIRESNPINLDDAATDAAKRKFAVSPLNVSVFEIPKSLKKEILRKGLPTYGTGSPLDPAIYGKTPERMIGSVQGKEVLRRSAGESPLMPSEDLMTSPLMPRQEVPRILRPREAFGLAAYNAGARSGGYTVEP